MGTPEAEKKIMDLHGQGLSNQAIADFLNKNSTPAFRGGIWHKGTVGKIVKRLKDSPKTKSEVKTEDLKTVRSAYQAVLKELDAAKSEISGLRKVVQAKEEEISRLKTGIRELTQDKHNRQEELQNMLNMELTGQSGSGNILSEILNRLTAIELHTVQTAKAEKQKSLNISGWTIQKDGRGFYRGFRNIAGKVRGVYLGKSISDTALINQKLTTAYQKYTGNAETETMPEKEKEDDVRADRNADAEDPEADREEFRYWVNLLPGEGSFVRIYRIRRKLNWSREKFDRVLTALMADYAVEVHRGDPSILTQEEIEDSYSDENGNLYITLSWYE